MRFSPIEDKEAMLAKISGRTGNLRAPTLRIRGAFYVGYNEELYKDIVQKSDDGC